MLVRKAKVIRREENKVILDATRNKMCGCCSNLFCGANKQKNIVLEGYPELKAGDLVELGVQGKNLVLVSIFSFLVPSILFIGIIYVLEGISGPVLSALFASIGIIAYFVLIKLFVFERIKDKIRCQVRKV